MWEEPWPGGRSLTALRLSRQFFGRRNPPFSQSHFRQNAARSKRWWLQNQAISPPRLARRDNSQKRQDRIFAGTLSALGRTSLWSPSSSSPEINKHTHSDNVCLSASAHASGASHKQLHRGWILGSSVFVLDTQKLHKSELPNRRPTALLRLAPKAKLVRAGATKSDDRYYTTNTGLIGHCCTIPPEWIVELLCVVHYTLRLVRDHRALTGHAHCDCCRLDDLIRGTAKRKFKCAFPSVVFISADSTFANLKPAAHRRKDPRAWANAHFSRRGRRVKKSISLLRWHFALFQAFQDPPPPPNAGAINGDLALAWVGFAPPPCCVCNSSVVRARKTTTAIERSCTLAHADAVCFVVVAPLLPPSPPHTTHTHTKCMFSLANSGMGQAHEQRERGRRTAFLCAC